MPNEPDRYDLDEMMDRLKRRNTDESQDDGELVTREDGSQAVRVRRRKRRSSQPHKERRRRVRMFQVTAVLVLILLAVLAVGFVTIYVNTQPYRNKLTAKIGEGTGADVGMKQFRMNPTGANAHSVQLAWPEGNGFESLLLNLLSADVSPLRALGGSLSGGELNVQSGKLVLRQPISGQPKYVVETDEAPSPVHFDQSSIKNFEIEFNSAQPGAFRLVGSEATFMSRTEERNALLRLARGDVRARGWPLLRMDRAYIDLDDDRVEIVGLSLKHADDDRGKLEFKGVLNPHQAEGPGTLSVTAEAFLTSGLLGDSLGNLLHGRVGTTPELGEGQLNFSYQDAPSTSLSMAFQSEVGESFLIQNLPCLYGLSQTLGDEWFSRPNFSDRARGQLVRRGDRVELAELDFLRKDRMMVRGKLTEKAGALSGALELGIAAGMIQAAENQAINEMFGSPTEGFRWIQLEITGTSAAPIDNFTRLYEEALVRLNPDSQTTK